MSQRIVVKSVITKPTKKEGTNITTIEDEKGAKMSAFNDSALAQVHAGDILEVEISIDGKYANITGWKLIESKPQPPQVPAPQPRQEAFKADPEKIASMERQKATEIDGRFRDTALMQACEIAPKVLTPQIEVREVLALADKFYAWLKGEKAPEKPVVKAQDKETPAPAQQEATLPIVDGLTGRPEGMPADITTGAKMASYAGKRGIDSVQFTAITQAANPNDLKTKAQLIAAWNVLAPKMKVK